MRLFYAIILLALIGVMTMQNLLWIAGILAIVFTLKFTAVSLVVLAILIDAYFGAFDSMPYLSIVALCWYVCSELIRLRLRIMD